MKKLSTYLRFWVIATMIFEFVAYPNQVVYADSLVCGVPGKDGPVTVNSTAVLNTYYQGIGTASAGATSITLGAASGSLSTIVPGDLLLVIQMQGAEIDSSNTGAYGSGTAGDPGSGNLVNASYTAGQYEYVIATNSVGAGGGALNISAPLTKTYDSQNYPVGLGNQGQRRFQVIRIPQYSSLTISGSVVSLPWNGSVGGVVALDVAGMLNFNGGTVDVSGQGFRGGGGIRYTGDTGSDTDYRTTYTNTANGSKGEGVSGTPRLVFNGTSVIDTGSEGYPNGSFGRGAPGNAGGGSTDGNPSANDENSGGGGGGNGGAGGQGGFAWSSVDDSGGFGGDSFSAMSTTRLAMGGGGGAGTINNNDPLLSSGGPGGGLVMVRAGTVTGNGTINSNGADGQDQILNDSGGGAGAGGSIQMIAQSGSLPVALNINANGGDGGDAWPGQAPGIFYPGARHGPGAGGGGGVIYLSSSAGVLSVAGGQNGVTTTANDSYGAEPGSPGVSNTTITPTDIPTGISGAGCIPTPIVVKTTSTPQVTQTPTGTSGVYKIEISIPVNQGTALGFTASDILPSGFTYNSTTSIITTGGATRITTSDPTAGTATPAWGTFDIPGGGQVEITFTVDIDSTVIPGTYQNPATATYTDPTRTVANGKTDTLYDYLNNTGEDITVLAPTNEPSLTVLKSETSNGPYVINDTIDYDIVVTNTGDVPLTGVTVVDNSATVATCTPPQPSTLAPGESMTCPASHVVTQADVNNGSYANTATGDSDQTPPSDSTVTVNIAQGPALSVLKSETSSGPYVVNDTIIYSIVVTNTGNTTLTAVTVIDNSAVLGTCSPAQPATLTIGAVMTCPASHVVTQIDLDNRTYVNTATADSNETPPSDSTVTVNFGVADLSLVKTVTNTTPNVSTNINFILTVTNGGPEDATGVVVTDNLPNGFTFISASPSKGTYSNATGLWQIGDLALNESVTLNMTVRVNASGSHTNTAEIVASLLIDPDSTPNNQNPNEDDQDSVAVVPQANDDDDDDPSPPPSQPAPAVGGFGFLIPVTGFAPNVVTDLSNVPFVAYDDTSITLDIPSLSVDIPIVGVPKNGGTWDVSWLGDQAGWLEGSAFPSWNGNSVLTSHVYLSNGKPGPFAKLHELQTGDQVVVHAFGQKYTFEVQTNATITPTDRSVMKHEERPWLTLVTCADYDFKTGTYKNRFIVRAVLVKVSADK